MSKTIYIIDKDALDVDRVVVNSPDLKGCKIFISCDVCEVLKKGLLKDREDNHTEN